ncbi:hypothetical protein C8F04DRAFT_1178305 [Mycena alexandri]|uniref:Uncharacterized protein n=1 Tax=Mycena alexandri TaxID=1745969 RepID=A0AAD6X944_9AGAR|nr:hypothetical protein C8F04DRAFT_1178305 [Mycena alexandri]
MIFHRNQTFRSVRRSPTTITGSGPVANLESMWVGYGAVTPPRVCGFNLRCQGLRFGQSNGKYAADGQASRAMQLLTTPQFHGGPSARPSGRLSSEYGISAAFGEKVMEKYIIQTSGNDALEAESKIAPCRYLMSATNHYSCQRQPGIMGSTEHGAVEPLSEVLALREKYHSLGLSFLVHADAAWGGYFATLTISDPAASNFTGADGVPKRELGYLRDVCDGAALTQLWKGYILYPAGGLCYRDEHLRFLVTWSSPYLDTDKGGIEAMGVYSVEEVNPARLRVIGLHESGYGRLLGEAMFTSVKIPAEEEGRPKSEIEQQQNYIQKRIANRDN